MDQDIFLQWCCSGGEKKPCQCVKSFQPFVSPRTDHTKAPLTAHLEVQRYAGHLMYGSLRGYVNDMSVTDRVANFLNIK